MEATAKDANQGVNLSPEEISKIKEDLVAILISYLTEYYEEKLDSDEGDSDHEKEKIKKKINPKEFCLQSKIPKFKCSSPRGEIFINDVVEDIRNMSINDNAEENLPNGSHGNRTNVGSHLHDSTMRVISGYSDQEILQIRNKIKGMTPAKMKMTLKNIFLRNAQRK